MLYRWLLSLRISFQWHGVAGGGGLASKVGNRKSYVKPPQCHREPTDPGSRKRGARRSVKERRLHAVTIPVQSHGIFTCLRYSSHLAPNISDNLVSSSRENIRDPVYMTIPIATPSHVFKRIPAAVRHSFRTARAPRPWPPCHTGRSRPEMTGACCSLRHPRR